MRIKEYDWLRWRNLGPTDKEILVLVLEPTSKKAKHGLPWPGEHFHVLMFTDDGVQNHIFSAEVLDSVWELMPSCDP